MKKIATVFALALFVSNGAVAGESTTLARLRNLSITEEEAETQHNFLEMMNSQSTMATRS